MDTQTLETLSTTVAHILFHVDFLSKLNSALILTPYFRKVLLNSILPSTLRSPKFCPTRFVVKILKILYISCNVRMTQTLKMLHLMALNLIGRACDLLRAARLTFL